MDESILSDLVGKRLTSVKFVLDYCIIGFADRCALSTTVWPELRGESSPMSVEKSGFRNRLCSFIDHQVVTITLSANQTLDIHFDLGTMHFQFSDELGPKDAGMFFNSKRESVFL
ncbi:MAG: hypothetical protein IAI50_02570 [Candidatus Eremiobacteraeota bacterium]|nr:hypothetical protein [Candidatus Eremiobacteraeota bacterium]